MPNGIRNPIYPAQAGRRNIGQGQVTERFPNANLLRQFLQRSQSAPTGAAGRGAPRGQVRAPTGPTSPLYPSPVNFSQTPAGRAILQRVLQQYAGRRNMGRGAR